MAVEKDTIVAFAGDVDEDERRTAREAYHLERHPRDRLRARPLFHQRHRSIHVPVFGPLGVEHGRLVGNLDVLDEPRNDLLVPDLRDEASGVLRAHRRILESPCATPKRWRADSTTRAPLR